MVSSKLPKKLALLSLLSISAYIVILHSSLSQIMDRQRRPLQTATPNSGGVQPIARGPDHPAAYANSGSASAPSVETGVTTDGAGGRPSDDSSAQEGGWLPVQTAQVAEQPLKKPQSAAAPLKHILYWNEFYGSMEFMWGSGQKPFIEHGCEVNTCFGTNNRTFMKMEEYDAILFHVQTLPFFDWPRVRSPHQRYVFVTLESAQYLPIPLIFYNNKFNLTLTYRRDSDFPYRYGAMEPVPSPPPTSTRNYAAGKTKLVAWFVSHCSSKSNRGQYAKLLQKHIPVDIYGDCGPFKCPRSADNNCHKKLLNNDYKFYLSFENSICNDYVTEKLFDSLKFDVVPVVLGGANYSSFAPPGSYIDALKYTPEELAKYLLKLDKDDAAYNAYFQWKGKYKSVEKRTFQRSSFCDLCKYLHSDEIKVYKSMKKWWVKGQCLRAKW